MEEQNTYEIVKNLVDKDGNKMISAIKLWKNKKTINRLIQKCNDNKYQMRKVNLAMNEQ